MMPDGTVLITTSPNNLTLIAARTPAVADGRKTAADEPEHTANTDATAAGAGTKATWTATTGASAIVVRVRFHIIRNARIETVGKSQSCMVSKVRIIWKQTVVPAELEGDEGSATLRRVTMIKGLQPQRQMAAAATSTFSRSTDSKLRRCSGSQGATTGAFPYNP